ncbi:phospholipase D-like domain-containing protein [Salsuginibacillus halophilus]|nr:phospholipase D-like domain-containing protein [Salsuginibacillus halophilus]
MEGQWMLFILLILIGWITLDFYLGRKTYTTPAFRRFADGEIELIDDGESLYEKLHADIQHAAHTVDLSFFIFRSDDTGERFLTLLERKAAEGVRVRLMVDQVGSALTRSRRKSLETYGVKVKLAAPVRPPFFLAALNRRNHRKTTVIDGKAAYTGGFNAGEEYIGRRTKLGFWRDYHVRLTDGAADTLQQIFDADWAENTAVGTKEGDGRIQIVASNGTELEKVMGDMINKAESSLDMVTPYYIPPASIHAAVVKATARGVNVRLLVPMFADHPFVKETGFTYFQELLEAGADVLLYNRGFFHGKAVIIDRQLADVGTANLDYRSMYWNQELNLIIENHSVLQTLNEAVQRDMADAVPLYLKDLTDRSAWQRLKGGIGRRIRWLL